MAQLYGLSYPKLAIDRSCHMAQHRGVPPGNDGLPMNRTADTRQNWAGVLLAALIVAALILLAWFAPLAAWGETVEGWAQSRPLQTGLLFVISTTIFAVLFMPGSVIAMVGGYLFGLWVGAGLALVAMTLGACAAFVVGRWIARDWVRTRLEQNPTLGLLERAVQSRAFSIVALTRLSLVMPYNVLNYAFAATGVGFGHFALATLVGMVPAAGLWTYVGTLAKSIGAIAAGDVEPALPGGVVVVIGLTVLVALVVIVHRAARRALDAELDGKLDA